MPVASAPSSQLCPPLRAYSQFSYLEGQGDLVSRLIMGIIRVTIWAIGAINLLTKSLDPPSNHHPSTKLLTVVAPHWAQINLIETKPN